MMIEQHNPIHPGKFIQRVYLTPNHISPNELSRGLKVSNDFVSHLVNAKNDVCPVLALKLSVVLGQSPESWLQMQTNFNLDQAKKEFNFSGYEQLKLIPKCNGL